MICHSCHGDCGLFTPILLFCSNKTSDVRIMVSLSSRQNYVAIILVKNFNFRPLIIIIVPKSFSC